MQRAESWQEELSDRPASEERQTCLNMSYLSFYRNAQEAQVHPRQNQSRLELNMPTVVFWDLKQEKLTPSIVRMTLESFLNNAMWKVSFEDTLATSFTGGRFTASLEFS